MAFTGSTMSPARPIAASDSSPQPLCCRNARRDGWQVEDSLQGIGQNCSEKRGAEPQGQTRDRCKLQQLEPAGVACVRLSPAADDERAVGKKSGDECHLDPEDASGQ